MDTSCLNCTSLDEQNAIQHLKYMPELSSFIPTLIPIILPARNCLLVHCLLNAAWYLTLDDLLPQAADNAMYEPAAHLAAPAAKQHKGGQGVTFSPLTSSVAFSPAVAKEAHDAHKSYSASKYKVTVDAHDTEEALVSDQDNPDSALQLVSTPELWQPIGMEMHDCKLSTHCHCCSSSIPVPIMNLMSSFCPCLFTHDAKVFMQQAHSVSAMGKPDDSSFAGCTCTCNAHSMCCGMHHGVSKHISAASCSSYSETCYPSAGKLHS